MGLREALGRGLLAGLTLRVPWCVGQTLRVDVCTVSMKTSISPSYSSQEESAGSVTDDAVMPRNESVQVVARVAEVLRLLGAVPRGLSLAELTTRTGLPRTTTHRLVHALIDQGFVYGTPPEKLRIGPALVGIALGSRRELRRELAPRMERLAESLQETVDLAVLDGGDALFVEQFPSPRALRVVSGVGARFPLHCTASGKILLSAMAPDEAAALLPPHLERFTEFTITDRQQLLAEVELARATGLAYDRQEHTLAISAIGTLVRDAVGPSAAITVVMPSVRFEDDERAVAVALLRVRDAIGGEWSA